MREILDHSLCLKLAEAAKAKSDEVGKPIVFSIADDHGTLKYLHRFDGAIIPSVDISQKKAYTAATLGQPTAEFGRIAQVDGEAFGINVTHPALTIFGGGFPLKIGGETVGGIGVSGGSVDEDEAVAKSAVEAFEREVRARGLTAG